MTNLKNKTMGFYIGQKVVCVKPDSDGDLVKDKVYTVSEVDYDGAIRVKEAIITGGWLWFNSWRFRSIDEYGDSMSLAMQLVQELNQVDKAKNPVKKPQNV